MLRKFLFALFLLTLTPIIFLSNSGVLMGIRETISSHSMWAGYASNHFAREFGKDIERMTRPFKYNQPGFAPTAPQEFAERLKRSFHVMICAPLSLLGIPLSFLFFSIASLTAESRLEIKKTDQPPPRPINEREVTIMSINSCFQEGPFAPLTGGIVPPLEPVGNDASRVAALAHQIATSKMGSAQSSPDILVGQEFHDLKSQDIFVKEMQKHGYNYFILDRAPHPVLNNSGLFVASKRELGQISFIPFPIEDRNGLAKGTQQGAIAFSVLDHQKQSLLRIFNTHLNYGDGPENQEARNRQLKKHIIPQFRNSDVPSILVGDFNFDTADPSIKKAAGLDGYTNVIEGQITCSDEGKILLRGKTTPPELEKIDALIANSQAVNISQIQIEKLEANGTLLSDHFSIRATIET
jgi:endonuclease/exonuclease/phosphatase family metal-dependent hydrolase